VTSRCSCIQPLKTSKTHVAVADAVYMCTALCCAHCAWHVQVHVQVHVLMLSSAYCQSLIKAS